MHTPKEVEAILDVFQAHGHREVRMSSSCFDSSSSIALQLDTARVYCGGTAEGMLGKIDWKKRGLVMETKLYPNVVRLSKAGPSDAIFASFTSMFYRRTLASKPRVPR